MALISKQAIFLAALTLAFLMPSAYSESGLCEHGGAVPSHCAEFGDVRSEKRERVAPNMPIFMAQSDGYSRKSWRYWIDQDRDCQNERNELLIRSSLEPVQFKTEKNCVVIKGRWRDDYTGQIHDQARKMVVDHLVGLKHAHRHGAQGWSKAKKRTFANDADNLLLTTRSLKRKKKHHGVSDWLPPNEAFHCEYVQRWQRIKLRYALRSETDEKEWMDAKLAECQQLP